MYYSMANGLTADFIVSRNRKVYDGLETSEAIRSPCHHRCVERLPSKAHCAHGEAAGVYARLEGSPG